LIEIPKVFAPLRDPKRYKVMYGGRGGAKTWNIARTLILKSLEEPLLILCTRELQKSIKQSVHRVIKNQILAMDLEDKFHITETSIKTVKGIFPDDKASEFIFLGTKYNPQEIKSTEGVDICWIEEAHNLSEASWDIIDPTIRKQGSEIWISFNPRFKFDHIYQMFVYNEPPEDAWVKEVSYKDNPWFKETTMPAQMKRMKAKDHDKYLWIWEGKLKTLSEGAIFGTQISKARRENRITPIPIDNLPVYTFWDLGRNDHTAIWFMQEVGKELRLIDYYENRLQDIPHYCRVLRGKATEAEMEEMGITAEAQERRAHYSYETHYMPHDVEAQVLGMPKTRREQFEDGLIKPIETVDRIKAKEDAISLARDIFPRVWIDPVRCERGLDCLQNYRYKYDDEKDTHQMTPHHDWASNGADAFMQLAQSWRGKPVRMEETHVMESFDPFAS
jgi:phage terminase large subunit